jgi:Rieske 2Fe-2S family protein
VRADPSSDTPELQRTLRAEAYLGRDQWSREVEAIFAREWLCAGREEHLRKRGDYLHVRLAGESVLLVRASEGDVRGYYNVCRHRGSRLVIDEAPLGSGKGALAPDGRFKGSIRCPYHAWTYGLDGSLRHAPFLSEGDGLRRERLGLYPVAVETWGGFIFVRLDPGWEGQTLSEQLGALRSRTARYPLGALRTARRITYDVAANWKVIVENYNECYHCGPVHPELCEVVPAFKEGGGAGLDWEAGVPHREGATTFSLSGITARSPFPELTEEERVRHKGELIYPNLMLSLSSDHVAAFTLWPEGPGRTLITCDFLFDPSEMRRTGFDPSDAVEFWDLVNRQDWRICESVQLGMAARPFRFGYYAPMEDLSLDIRRYVGRHLAEPGGLSNA